MKTTVFEAKDYKNYLNERLDDPEQGYGRGARSRLSQALGCQTAYTAQVLRGPAHFSLEQAEATNRFLSHTEDEADFFLLLVQHDRAGSPALRKRLKRQLDAWREERRSLANRIDVKATLNPEEQAVYYSAWHLSAIHALASVPGFQTAEALEFLLRTGILARDSRGTLKIGQARLHLTPDSPWIARHHANWRLRAIASAEKREPSALHYSSVTSISHEDAERIREILLKSIEAVRPIVRDSREERIQGICLDFFEV